MSYKLNVGQPIIEDNGTMSQAFRQFTQEASLSIPIVGTGTPEGVIEAVQYSLYLDGSGSAGAIQYRKMLPSIGGDRTKGWILV
jgi:hypothetical protein|tara:strand:- start:1538 stop:1789 length:252 start_codon:yes stop_codon:yes gene_type:complete